MPSQRKFRSGDKVFVPHTDKHYPAKVLKGEKRPDGLWYYLLHYTGWNKKWDEWVEEAGIQPSTSAEISTPMEKKIAPPEVKNTPPSQQKNINEEVPTIGIDAMKTSKKRKAEDNSTERQLKLVLEVPAILKKQLLDEYELVTGAHKTVVLPRRPNVTQILKKFYDHGKKELKCANTELQLLITGLEEYMDKTLEDFLLYEIEWKLSIKLLDKRKICASAIYGAEHLLRLLFKLPDLIPQTSVTPQQASALDARLHDFLDFLVANRHDFFANFKEYKEQDTMDH